MCWVQPQVPDICTEENDLKAADIARIEIGLSQSALPVLGQEKAEELYRRLMALEEKQDIRSLMALCR